MSKNANIARAMTPTRREIGKFNRPGGVVTFPRQSHSPTIAPMTIVPIWLNEPVTNIVSATAASAMPARCRSGVSAFAMPQSA